MLRTLSLIEMKNAHCNFLNTKNTINGIITLIEFKINGKYLNISVKPRQKIGNFSQNSDKKQQ